MRIRRIGSVCVLALAFASAPLSACAQQAPAGDLQKQVDALRSQVGAMQKDLDEIKALLAPLRARQSPTARDVPIELGNRAIKGDAMAKLTFIELTDYQ